MAQSLGKNLLEIFDEYDKFYIPIFQREYVWSHEKVIEFLEDLFVSYNKNIQNRTKLKYYLGTVVGMNTEIIKEIVLIDGQQRLTTTILFLIALNKFNSNLTSNNQIIKLHPRDVSLIEKYLFKNETINSLKIEYEVIHNGEYLREILSMDVNDILNNKDKNLIFKNFYYIWEWLNSKISNKKDDEELFLSNFLYMLEQTMISFVQIQENENPTMVFEKINSTGTKLTGFDLIRNYIFFHSFKKNFKDNNAILERKFNELTNLIDSAKFDKNEQSNRNSFFRYLLLIMGYTNELVKKDDFIIFRTFKSGVKNLDFSNPIVVKELIDSLLVQAKICNFIFKTKFIKLDEINIQEFTNIEINTYYCLIHSYIWYKFEEEKKINLSLNIDDFLKNKAKEHYLYILKICMEFIVSFLFKNKNTKNLTRTIPLIISQYKEHLNKNSTNISLKEYIKTKSQNDGYYLLNRKDIISLADSAQIYSWNSKRTKMLLMLIESYNNKGETNLSNVDSFSVEHLIPQTPEDTSYFAKNETQEEFDDNHKKYNDLIGNLTLLTRSANSFVSNNNWNYKKDFFDKKSTITLNKEMINYDQWNYNLVKERSKRLMSIYCDFLNIQ